MVEQCEYIKQGTDNVLLTDDNDGPITCIHTLTFKNAEERKMFHSYADQPDGLPVARGAKGNLFACPYDSIRDDNITYMISRWETQNNWDSYFGHRKDISPDWFLPNCEPHTVLRLRELDSSPTKQDKAKGECVFGLGKDAVLNIHIWQFENTELRDEINSFLGQEPGLRSSALYPGNLFVSGFEAIERENQLVAINGWESMEIFLAYRQMRRDTAPEAVRSFLADEVMVQSKIVEGFEDPRV